jgi:uncharacterized membrane protein
MGLAILLAGLVLFVAPHVFTTRRDARAAVITLIGEWPYKGLYSLVAIVGVILMGWGFARYRATGWVDVWYPPPWTRHIAVALTWPAIVFIVAAYIPGNIKRGLKHPMLVGVKLWAFAHLISNGDLGSIVLFGGILAWAVFDRISLKTRTDPGAPPIPIGGWRSDVAALIIGTLVYLALGFVFHPLLVGMPVFGTPAYGF